MSEDWVLYEKNPRTKIATITLNRPEKKNAPTTEMRLRYADLLHRANIDDDVKVLVIRGVGQDLGTGVDLPDFLATAAADDPEARLEEYRLAEHADDVTFPPAGSYRNSGMLGPWFANAQSGCRSLREFQKISILQVQGYCYGWHFYQAADADLVIASDDALFGHAAFRYAGWGPRMWSWALTMGTRRFKEMLFTGRPFTADEMYDCNFVNSVVPRDQLDAEVAKYADACSRSRPTDTVHLQKTFFHIFEQFQGEYLGSLLAGLLESFGPQIRPDRDDFRLDDETMERGLTTSVKDNDEGFPPDWRLSRAGRRRA
ncbi:enoyl-CoA hydratase/isomerase family protein [Cryptosporangium sp. NPDC048952]|uniref:enoyl-CoA hydratase/isomerase family protein n=1 Tax=Cryptosporangium sp. NPDC048952 TaxID=3363961 RepID=UPI00371E632F